MSTSNPPPQDSTERWNNRIPSTKKSSAECPTPSLSMTKNSSMTSCKGGRTSTTSTGPTAASTDRHNTNDDDRELRNGVTHHRQLRTSHTICMLSELRARRIDLLKGVFATAVRDSETTMAIYTRQETAQHPPEALSSAEYHLQLFTFEALQPSLQDVDTSRVLVPRWPMSTRFSPGFRSIG